MGSETMLAVTAPFYSDPSNYQLSELPRPVVSEPTDVVIQVHAASINPIDVKKAAGMFKLAIKDEYENPLPGTWIWALLELNGMTGFPTRSASIVLA